MTTRTLIIAITAFAAAAYVLRSSNEQQTPESVAPRTRVPPVTRPAHGWQDHPRVAAGINRLPRPAAAQSAVEPAASEEVEVSADKTAAPRALETDQIQEQMEERFYAEAADAAWDYKAVRTIEQRIAGLMPASSALRSVECRASFCRIETSHASIEEFRELVHGAFLSPDTQLWNGGFFASVLGEPPAAGAGMVAVAYLAREGQALPPPDRAAP